jgi:hypothetical protein
MEAKSMVCSGNVKPLPIVDTICSASGLPVGSTLVFERRRRSQERKSLGKTSFNIERLSESEALSRSIVT